MTFLVPICAIEIIRLLSIHAFMAEGKASNILQTHALNTQMQGCHSIIFDSKRHLPAVQRDNNESDLKVDCTATCLQGCKDKRASRDIACIKPKLYHCNCYASELYIHSRSALYNTWNFLVSAQTFIRSKSTPQRWRHLRAAVMVLVAVFAINV